MTEYRVLARKYRPTNFDDLVGQDVLVRTLTNAISTGRIHHAFLLTGIRGIGKTTTARIIARALNCLSESGPTIKPCGKCANCIAIGEDRHVDVMEMDAASRTGVDNMRELIETVHYAPTSARYKIYIIDEVHMLSVSAFNALLKTLEEPPPHVKFIFATTELRKIPVTILSRCQRFDLKRLDNEAMAKHLGNICAKESIEVEEEALKLIASAAEGSVRDGLSLLDQSIAHATSGKVEAAQLRDMLGMADRSQLFMLLHSVFAGDVAASLTQFAKLQSAGAEPGMILQDLLELVHFISRLKATPEMAKDHVSYTETERKQGTEMAEKLSVVALTRAWQMLLKGFNEVRFAPNTVAAAEMILIRTAHASTLPAPADALRKLQEEGATPSSATSAKSHASSSEARMTSANPLPPASAPRAPAPGNTAPAFALEPEMASLPDQPLMLASFEQVVSLFAERREPMLHHYLFSETSLVSFQRGKVELNLSPAVPVDFAGKVGKLLSDWAAERWVIVLSQTKGQPTLKEQAEQRFEKKKQDVANEPLVAAILEAFPGAEISKIE